MGISIEWYQYLQWGKKYCVEETHRSKRKLPKSNIGITQVNQFAFCSFFFVDVESTSIIFIITDIEVNLVKCEN